jgi:tetrahydromethanopterin S-methyltransferase subunit A
LTYFTRRNIFAGGAMIEHVSPPHTPWPVVPGAYAVGDPAAPVAICTLTDDALYPALARLPGVAIAGRVNTANLGIEDLIVNVTANPHIRFVVLCGKESPLFRAGQTLRALVENGTTVDRRVVGAEGFNPVLGNVTLERIERFRHQIELTDRTGESDAKVIEVAARELSARDLGVFEPEGEGAPTVSDSPFIQLKPGGQREPLWYDPKGFFVITLDRPAGEIAVRHYTREYRPAHEMRGHSAEAIVLGLLREELVSQLSHAGYLGAELAKAEAALRLELHYEQDRPLRPRSP